MKIFLELSWDYDNFLSLYICWNRVCKYNHTFFVLFVTCIVANRNTKCSRTCYWFEYFVFWLQYLCVWILEIFWFWETDFILEMAGIAYIYIQRYADSFTPIWKKNLISLRIIPVQNFHNVMLLLIDLTQWILLACWSTFIL